MSIIELAPTNPYGLSIESPVVVAAGALGYGVEYGRTIEWGRVGALVTRTTSFQPRRASVAPQMIETPAGLLVTGGDVNPGLRYIEERCASTWATWDVKIIVSVGGASAEQCADVAAQLDTIEGVAGVEFSLLRFRDDAARAVAGVREATQLPLIVKLPLDAPDLATLAATAVAAGADTLALNGPPIGLIIDPATGMRSEGWLCGPALRPLALRQTARLADSLTVPLIAGCGVGSADDARQFLAAGASAVSIGAALLADPRRANEIAAALGDNPSP